MFLDASAIVAIVAPEEDGPILAARLDQAERVLTSPIAIYEAVLAVARRREISVTEAEEAIASFAASCSMHIIAITAEIGRAAIEAFARYGRGRHAAQLNMGDCFAYACARSHGVPLLYKGDDFALTDIAAA